MSVFFKTGRLSIYLLTTAIIIQLFLLVRSQNVNEKMRSLLDSSSEKLAYNQEDGKIQKERLISIMWNQWQLETKKIKKGLILIDSKNHLVSLDSLIKSKKGKVLILRFFKSSCEDCQVQEMKMIQEVIQQEKVIVIASFKTAKDLLVYVQSQRISLPVYQLKDTEIMLEGVSARIDQVYCFVTDLSKEVTRVHIGQAGLPEFSKSYYKLIAKNLNAFN